MSKRIKIVGNSLVVEDTVTSKQDLDRPAKDMYYDTNALDNGTIIFIERDGSKNAYIESKSILLANAVNSLDIAFTEATFRTFVRTNLGFNSAGSSALTTKEYYQRVISDGGTVESLNCARVALKESPTASLLMQPTGKKATKLYSVLPDDGTGDFTVVRNSDATYVDKNGIIQTALPNVARIDYTDGDCGALLLEPQSTNLVTYSEDLSNASWSKTAGIVTSYDTITAPNGLLTADSITDNVGATSFKTLSQLVTVPVNSTITCSLFIKKETSEVNYGGIAVEFTNPTTIKVFYAFNAVNGTFSNSLGGVLVVDSINVYDFNSDWWRIEITATDTGSRAFVRFTYYATLSTNFTTTNFAIGSSRKLWGFQVEAGTTATSYIPTQGSSVTRAADVVTDGGDVNTFNSEEGTLFVEMAALSDDLTQRYITISDGSNINIVRLGYFVTSNYILYQFNNGALTANLATTSFDITQQNKIAVVYKLNRFELWVNGVKKAQDTSGNTLPIDTLNVLSFTQGTQTSNLINAKVRQLQVFKTALSDAELISLTS